MNQALLAFGNLRHAVQLGEMRGQLLGCTAKHFVDRCFGQASARRPDILQNEKLEIAVRMNGLNRRVGSQVVCVEFSSQSMNGTQLQVLVDVVALFYNPTSAVNDREIEDKAANA